MKAHYIALFRGINVGGKNRLPMKALVGILEENGYTGIQTHIQSGNVIFQSTSAKSKMFARIVGAAIADRYGFQPGIVVLSAQELKKASAANPFPKAEAESKFLHLYFLNKGPKAPDLEALNRLKSDSESFRLIGNVFYLHAPDGIGRSKLAARAEKLLGVEATARNWNTVTRLLEMTRVR
jgi:uncharacterized protein (DUF1697 family)